MVHSKKESETKVYNIHVKLMTFEVDSSSLIDFETVVQKQSSLTIPPYKQGGIVYLVKKDGIVISISGDEELQAYLESSPEPIILAKLESNDKGCVVSDPGLHGTPELSEKRFKIVSSRLARVVAGRYAKLKPMSVVIKEGDRIEFGRITLVVRYLAHHPVESLDYIHELLTHSSKDAVQGQMDAQSHVDDAIGVTSPDATSTTVDNLVEHLETDASFTDAESIPDKQLSQKNDIQRKMSLFASPSDVDQKICRICLEDESSGPLVVPCKCKGSMKYVHLSCVRQWVQGRLKLNDENGVPNLSYFLQNLSCELCNVAYPSYVEVGSVVTEFLGLEEPDHPYAVLEPTNTGTTGLHIVSVANGATGFGRGSRCSVVLRDISVSRAHAILEYRNGQFVLEDRGSKFGTLIQVDSPFRMQVDNDSPFFLKIGTDVLCVSAKPTRMHESLWCCSPKLNAVRMAI
ncbi:fha domain-containing protein [Babesia gibsoni]|uniref:Fha domain-containing protein n=1 Tax=Babesia gibsoni TaxID=33632 RepID=A0AAD8LKT3_BABGI|nr:fha domain-containing protein [Babesia gibsoni]